jgi:hypothetical protein
MVKWIGIGAAILALVTLVFIVCAAIFPAFREAARDIAIVILAVFQLIGSFLTIVLLLALLYVVTSLHRLAKESLLPKIDSTVVKVEEVLNNTRELTSNVRTSTTTLTTTTSFVAERVVSPIIRLSGFLTGAKASARSLVQRQNQTTK